MAAVGIDLGTTNTVVACVRGGRVQAIADEHGRKLLPSVVSFHPNGQVLVGQSAKERRSVDPRNTIASVKRLIGRAWGSEELKRSRLRYAFELKEGPGQGVLVVARGQEYTLPEISAFVLRRAREVAEEALGEPVDKAVITVPANFNELQRAATKVAGRVAGLEVLRIINEPTAAALAYGMGRSSRQRPGSEEGRDAPSKERVAIYDFGGGTFDCTLLDLSGNVFEVLATAGDSFLGGDDIDLAIAERMSASFLRQHRYDPLSDKQVFERLRAAAEVLKIELSTKERASATLKDVAFGHGGASLDLDFTMGRGELEVLSRPFVDRTFAVCQDALRVAQIDDDTSPAPPARGRNKTCAFDKIILVGGSTRVPVVRQRVEQFFGMPPLDRVNPEEVVAIGAAIQAAALTEVTRRRSIPAVPNPSRASFPDREEVTTPMSATTALIAEVEKLRPPAGPVPAAPLPPPAAPRPVLVDVTPRALLVETAGGWSDVVVQRNAKIPCERTRAFTTSSDMQTVVRVRVAQGEDPTFDANTYLGELELSGLRAVPRGEVTIEVRFEVDESGTLVVSARDVATGREERATLQLVGADPGTDITDLRARQAGTPVTG